VLLSKLLPKSGKLRFIYDYDFGDSWEHEIVVEKLPQAELDQIYPVCLEGQSACPPEDCGGIWGYANFLEAIGNKKHKEHKEMRAWIGGSFDPARFDVAAATKRMREGLTDQLITKYP
jgi:hypothetical protein